MAIVGGQRDLVLGDVKIRVHENFTLEMHIDTDEANAAELGSLNKAILRPLDVDDDDFLVYTSIEATAGLTTIEQQSA